LYHYDLTSSIDGLYVSCLVLILHSIHNFVMQEGDFYFLILGLGAGVGEFFSPDRSLSDYKFYPNFIHFLLNMSHNKGHESISKNCVIETN
jgi:hypothetical protein